MFFSFACMTMSVRLPKLQMQTRRTCWLRGSKTITKQNLWSCRLVGLSNDPSDSTSSVRNIDPSFINNDRVAYYRRLELHKNEIYDSADKPILRVIQEKFGRNVIVSQSIYMNDFHFSVQTDYMRACLTRTSE